MNKLADLRDDYTKGSLNRDDLSENPFDQFHNWMQQAIESKCLHPNAMSIATVDKDGMPNVRVVLLKDVSSNGFVFFTNYHSQKGNELTNNPKACLNFFWGELERQVRISGTIKKLPAHLSDEYFQSRPRASQIGAIVSPQSQIIPDDEYLTLKYQELEKTYQNQPIKRPQSWGGYVLNPQQIEFWQGRTSRLHDRFSYTKQADSWIINRLAP
nr:pyridoxamine 5'-phosphate oxidase [uncultured Carboxylicivirga sp.]